MTLQNVQWQSKVAVVVWCCNGVEVAVRCGGGGLGHVSIRLPQLTGGGGERTGGAGEALVGRGQAGTRQGGPEESRCV